MYLRGEDVFIQCVVSHIGVCEVLQDIRHLIQVVETNAERRSLRAERLRIEADRQKTTGKWRLS